MNNPVGLKGIEFISWSSATPARMEGIFLDFGFSKTHQHNNKNILLYKQNDIIFLQDLNPNSFAEHFMKEHGPSVSAMGWRVNNAQFAFEEAVRRGARPFEGDEFTKSVQAPAVYGIGDSLIYFIDETNDFKTLYSSEYEKLESPTLVPNKGFLLIDHLTNNVYKGTMQKWADFYKNIFGFEEIRYFDIKGSKTGLTSYALKSPCKTFSIPINEGNEKKSQIEEYLTEYKGPGIQHIAFLTNNLLDSLDSLNDIDTLDINEKYYKTVYDRVPNVTEDHNRIKNHQVLIDGDEKGYLLQIFTKNLFGPIFIEMIQRKEHHSFGEGNFQALFESIERDQERRGVL